MDHQYYGLRGERPFLELMWENVVIIARDSSVRETILHISFDTAALIFCVVLLLLMVFLGYRQTSEKYQRVVLSVLIGDVISIADYIFRHSPSLRVPDEFSFFVLLLVFAVNIVLSYSILRYIESFFDRDFSRLNLANKLILYISLGITAAFYFYGLGALQGPKGEIVFTEGAKLVVAYLVEIYYLVTCIVILIKNGQALSSRARFISVFSFLVVGLFDTMGTIIGISMSAVGHRKGERLPRSGHALIANGISTVSGSIMGASPSSILVESAAGVGAGGRTGLTAVVAGVLLLFASLFAPILSSIPSFATAPSLIMVGFLMFKNISGIDLSNEGLAEAIPAFLCVITMPLFYSIADGIAIGLISYVLIHIFTGSFRKVKPVMYLMTAVFVLKYIFL